MQGWNNGPEVFSSVYDKGKLLAKNFPKDSNPDGLGNYFPF